MICVQVCGESNIPLEGAKLRLEGLKESLYQRAREITEMLEVEAEKSPPMPLPPWNVLLPMVIQKVLTAVSFNFNSAKNDLIVGYCTLASHQAHAICRVTAECRTLLDKMIEENRVSLVGVRGKLNQLEMSKDGGGKSTDKDWLEHVCNKILLGLSEINEQNVFPLFSSCRSEEYESQLSLLQETVKEYEVTELALACIKTGECPAISGK